MNPRKFRTSDDTILPAGLNVRSVLGVAALEQSGFSSRSFGNTSLVTPISTL